MRRPPYRIDEISTHVVGVRLTRVPRRDWAHDLDAMARIAADIAYLVNPHNPPAPSAAAPRSSISPRPARPG
jgi:histidinol-phosphate/aromatic aminotransferase/cobyric acid decarboxylase-like protein